MQQLSSFDAQVLALEDGRNHAHVSLLAVLETPLTIAALRDRVARRFHAVAPLRWMLTEVPLSLDYPYWFDAEEVDLEFHVRELALPAPGTRDQLTEQVARLVSRPLDRSRPLWELYLLHGLAGGRCAILLKIHHAAVDGVAVGEAFALLTDEAEVTARTRPGSPAGIPGRLALLGRALARAPRQPLRALRALPALRHAPAIPHVRVARPRVAATSLAGPVTPHRRLALVRLPLGDVKRIKNHFGVTVNDVVVAMCAGALRSWLAARGELVATPLTTMVPVSVRTPEERGSFGNRVSAMLIEAPTDEPDATERVVRAHAAMSAAKARHAALPANAIQQAGEIVPPPLLRAASRASSLLTRRDAPVNTVISNVPGSPTPQTVAGARVEAIYPISAVMDGVGLNLTLWSYCDALHVGVVVDRDIVEDPRPIARALADAHAELLELVA
jgi:WS/DGAT/MGAT family acyltransferase